jgi:hypothetical protein
VATKAQTIVTPDPEKFDDVGFENPIHDDPIHDNPIHDDGPAPTSDID